MEKTSTRRMTNYARDVNLLVSRPKLLCCCRLCKDGAMTVCDLLIKLTKYLAIRTRADRPICTTYKHVEMPSSLLGLILARLAADVSVVNMALRLTADNLR